MDRFTRLGTITLAGLVVLLFAAPSFLYVDEMRSVQRILILFLFAYALNLLLHNTGIISFGHALFYGAGAYAVMLPAKRWDWPGMAGFAVAPLVGALLAIVSAPLVFRATRLFFALLTMAVAQVAYVIVVQWYSVTNGENGLHGVDLPAWMADERSRYYFVVTVVVIMTAVLRALIASPFGATLRAIRDNRERAMFLGIPVRRYEVGSYIVSATVAAVAGALSAVLAESAFPNQLHWSTSAQPILAVAIGGMTTFAGPLIGAAFVVGLQDFLRTVTNHLGLVYGVAVLIVALFMREGISGAAIALWRRLPGRRRTAQAPVRGRVMQPMDVSHVERQGVA